MNENTNYMNLPFTFEAVDNGTLTFRDSKEKKNEVIYYSVNDSEWIKDIRPLKLKLNAGDVLKFKGNCANYNYSSNASTINFTGKYNLKGNILSLVYGDEFLTNTVVPKGCFSHFCFNQMNLIDTKDLVIAADEIAESGCKYMFKGCKNMVSAPVLPATTVGKGAYVGMFWLCISLTVAPELPAVNLDEDCYLSMFNLCSSLTEAPVLPATKLKTSCYRTMFNGCTNLTKAQDVLPAKFPQSYCYYGMFKDCVNLEKAPVLMVDTFYPYNWCYAEMFSGCTKLNYIDARFTTIPSNGKNLLLKWVEGVADNGTFVKNPNAKWNVAKYTGVNGVPVNWTVVTEPIN